ncbi:MAG: hypothetical protein CMJ42_19255 [Phyllobacteriaceae bacterium]|nr:hypothetical protein [Phyllobacteriaceae bacterium]MBA92072.1 hypothetical protein [Phyllobacteriaceae bacterium]
MIMTRWQWILHQMSRRLFLRAGIISALSVASAVLAILLKDYIPENLVLTLGAGAVDSILTIIASSMLAVTTFSLSTVVQAFATAATTATPRATALLQDDTAVQNMLSTFVGAFIFSLAGLILLKTGIYGESGRVVLFLVTILVVVLLVMTLLRWIDFLLSFGRLDEVIRRVEKAANEAMSMRRERPYLGGIGLTDPDTGIPAGAWPVETDRIAHVLHIDMEALQDAAGEERRIYLLVLPGSYVHPGQALARVSGTRDDELARAVRNAITTGHDRSFAQDPRLGLIAMGEIASRALSPGINDPGTAIQIIGRVVNILSIWGRQHEVKDVLFNRVHVPPISLDELFDDFFLPVGRDGASVAEVQMHIFRALDALLAIGRNNNDPRYVEAVRRHAKIALDRCETVLEGHYELGPVRAKAEQLERRLNA